MSRSSGAWEQLSDTISDLEITWEYSVALATKHFFALSQRNNASDDRYNAMFCCVACATEHFSTNFESSIPQASRIWRVRRCLVGVHRCAFSLRWVDCEQADRSPHGRDGHAPFFCDTKSNFKGTLVLLLESKSTENMVLGNLETGITGNSQFGATSVVRGV